MQDFNNRLTHTTFSVRSLFTGILDLNGTQDILGVARKIIAADVMSLLSSFHPVSKNFRSSSHLLHHKISDCFSQTILFNNIIFILDIPLASRIVQN